MTDQTATRPVRAPLATLERHFLAAYVAGAGHDLQQLFGRDDEVAQRVLAEASRYASARLSEIDARAQYLQELHGQG